MSEAAYISPGEGAQASSRTAFAALVLMVYLLPAALILTDFIPFNHRYWLFSGVIAVAAVWVFARGASLESVGFRREKLKASLRANAWITFVALALIAILYFSGVLPPAVIPKWRWFFLLYVLGSCPAQEFLYRGALFHEMERAGIRGRLWRVGISSLLYCYPHSIFHSPLTLVVTFFIGVVWAWEYSVHRNLWGVILSHCILGTVSIFSGLI
jgi:membrane protease YdiL (CAAX protease family)